MVIGCPEVADASDPDRFNTTLTEVRKSEVDRHFSQFEGRQPGYAVGIVEDGDLVHARGFGSANLEHDIPIDPTTAFNIASLSKQFTAAALGILIQRGQVLLDAPVSQYLEEWPAPFQSVQVQHLVYMTSGLPEYYRLERSGGRDWGADYFTVEDALSAVMATPDLEFAPGSQWAYSNTNYQVIAEIVARVSGVPFSAFVEREIFLPLKMNRSVVNDDLGRIIAGRATGYNVDEEAGFRREIRRSPHYGGSGVFSTLEDLAKWDESFRSHSLGGPELTELLLQVRRFEHDKANDAFGLVWGEFDGRRTLWYEGGDLGFSSYMVRFPDDDLTVIVLSNLGTGYAAGQARAVLDILFGQ